MQARTERGTSIDRDGVLGALSNERRRQVLRVLRSTDGSMSLTELAVELAWEEREAWSGELRTKRFDRIRASLYHRHLPKLTDAGLVEFSPDRELVALSEDAEGIASLR